jgi:DNA-binding transcriptional ArsR family regulator
VNVLKALADPTRLAILKFVHQEPLLPSQLAARLRLRPATVSHHLKILRLAGLVFIRVGAGKETIYSARIEELQDSLAALEGFLKADEEH